MEAKLLSADVEMPHRIYTHIFIGKSSQFPGGRWIGDGRAEGAGGGLGYDSMNHSLLSISITKRKNGDVGQGEARWMRFHPVNFSDYL